MTTASVRERATRPKVHYKCPLQRATHQVTGLISRPEHFEPKVFDARKDKQQVAVTATTPEGNSLEGLMVVIIDPFGEGIRRQMSMIDSLRNRLFSLDFRLGEFMASDSNGSTFEVYAVVISPPYKPNPTRQHP